MKKGQRIACLAVLLLDACLLILSGCGGGAGSGGGGGGGTGGTPTPPGDVTADFGSRTSKKFTVPQSFIGANLGFTGNNFYQNTAALRSLVSAGVTELRVSADLQDVFLTQTANWSVIDPVISGLQAAGVRPTIDMAFTPPWQQPTGTNFCGSGIQAYHQAPTNPVAWGQIAAQFVAHMDQKFAGLISDYEIWNEPDSPTGLCTAVNSDQTRITTYKAMYAAAGQAIRAQAASDHAQIRIGGPALIQPSHASTWLPALLNDPTTAQYVDFVSYHQYMAGDAAIAMGLTWDTPNGNNPPVEARTQDPNTGIQAQYVQLAKLVAAGTQANAATTPIYFNEYNVTASFEPDCCRNSPIYGPLWNAMVLSDALNSVYVGVKQPPAKLQYFAGQAWFPTTTTGAAWFCLLGILDTRMDCAYDPSNPSGGASPYPQYYAYDLTGSSRFLGLGQGGTLANSVSLSSVATGLLASAFYTTGKMSVLLVNPTANDSASLVVKLQNPGTLNAAGATMYTLNRANPQIATHALMLTSLTDGYKVSVTVPHYTVVAISAPLQ